MMLKVLSLTIGGLAMFLFGMRLGSEGLQRAAGGKIHSWISGIADRRMLGILLGLGLSVLLQSSSAANVVLVGFVNAGLMTLRQALALMLGAGVGTTLTVQVIAFPISDLALFVLAIGVSIDLFSGYDQPRAVGRAMVGLSLLFLGMGMMKDGVAPLQSSEFFRALMVSMGRNPLMALAASTVLTAVIQSSAATLALSMALAVPAAGGGAPLLGPESYVPVVLGANLGTTATGLLASIGGERVGVRVASANVLMRLAGIALVLPWSDQVLRLVEGFGSWTVGGVSSARLIANMHTFYNVLLAVVFAPLLGLAARAVERLVPDRPEPGSVRTILDHSLLGHPGAALEQATLVLDRMSATVLEMLATAIVVFERGSDLLRQDVIRMDRSVDIAFEELRKYLARMQRGSMSGLLAEREVAILEIADGIEQMGDTIARLLMHQARKLMKRDATFSFEGFHEIRDLHAATLRRVEDARRIVATRDRRLARHLVRTEEDFQSRVVAVRRHHLERLREGRPETIESSAAHLDVIGALERVSRLATRIAEVVLEGGLTIEPPGADPATGSRDPAG